MDHARCPHCCASHGVQMHGGEFKCSRCHLFFHADVRPFVPEACQRYDHENIVWHGDVYDCSGCGRVGFGFFPSEPGTRVGWTEREYRLGQYGVIPGWPGEAAYTPPVPQAG